MNREHKEKTATSSQLPEFVRLWRLLRAALLEATARYKGPAEVKAELIRRGLQKPQQLPRSVRRELAQRSFTQYQEQTGYAYPLFIDMVATTSMFETYGPDVIGELINEKLINLQASQGMHTFEGMALEEGWQQD